MVSYLKARELSKVLMYGLSGLLVYAAWTRGGIYPPLQWPMTSLSLMLLGGFFFMDPNSGILKRILHDPIFYLGLLFLLLLTVQQFNSGYYLFKNEAGAIGMADRIPPRWLPWSVDPLAAWQMLHWFFPAWTVIILVRHGLNHGDTKRVLHIMVWNAAILSLVALFQKVIGAQKMLGLWTIPGNNFHGTFGYVNHAGAWFYLHAALSAGLAHQAVRFRQPPVQIGVWITCFLLCLIASCSSLSRAAGLVSIALIFVACGTIIHWGWKHAQGKQGVNFIGLACIMVLVGAVLYSGAGDGALAKEIDDTILGDRFEKTVDERTMQLPGAWKISKEYPLFGCGGWGYRWMALLYIPVDEANQWTGMGKANIHCDPLQFLAEFGWIGTLLMGCIVGVLVAQGMREGQAGALKLWIGLGLSMVFLHSWMDLPFRCPAILLSWCVLLAALPKVAVPSSEELFIEAG